MTKASDNAFPSILMEEGTEPTAPAAGHQRLYIDSTSHHLMIVDSGGTESSVGGSATFSGAKVYNNGTQSIASGSEVVILFGGEEYDTDAYHNTGSNTGRLTVPTTAKYRFTATIPMAAHAGSQQVTGFRPNGTGYVRGGYVNVIGQSFGVMQTLTCDLSLTANDYIEVFVYQNHGSAINVGGVDANPYSQAAFSVMRLG